MRESWQRNDNPLRKLRPSSGLLVGMVASVALAASPANAQDRLEISAFFGNTFSEGVSVNRATFENGFIDRVDAASGASFGGSVSFWLDEQIQVGFQFDRQESSLDVDGSAMLEVTSMDIYNYHAIATFHGGSRSSKVRPFAMLGLGATQYQLADLADVSFENEVKVSGTLGAGAKAYLTERFGLSVTGRWTPTYIKSSAAGVYCSPYWTPWYPGGCAVLEEADFSNQFQLSGGIIVRF